MGCQNERAFPLKNALTVTVITIVIAIVDVDQKADPAVKGIMSRNFRPSFLLINQLQLGPLSNEF
jgi:hypothetical protein